MKKLNSANFVKRRTVFKPIRLGAKIVLLNLFLLLSLTEFCAAQPVKGANQQSETDLPAQPIKSKSGLIKVQNNLVYGRNLGLIGNGALAFDDVYAYIATPNGLFRTARQITANSSFELIGFQNKGITNLYVHNNVLYVLKYSEENPGTQATDHSFLKSENHGATFTPLDGALEYCYFGYCGFLTPTQAIFKNGLIFLNAGAGLNLQVSNNNGESWTVLSGILEPISCYFPAFEIIGQRVLMGGECPLDFAYLRAGTLRPDLLDWLSPKHRPTNVSTPFLSNRNVQFITNKPNSTEVYAGVEGGLLKSIDAGQSFQFLLRYGMDSRLGSPYITHILFPSRNPNVIVVGGNDRAFFRLFLAYSKDNGKTWLDISNQTQSMVGAPSKADGDVDRVQFISEDPEGRILVGVTRPETNILTIVQLRADVAAFR